MRDYKEELEKRVAYIREVLKKSGASGIVYGNSGGKDSALVGILCKKACDDVLGVMMPCQSKRNFEADMEDGRKVAEQFGIETITVDLSSVKSEITNQVEKVHEVTETASKNIAPRLRMTTLYTIAASRNALVAGTGNASERYMGYFTKWGDGANDFNPMSDLTATEVFEFLRYLDAPESIITKAPSAGLFEGQTDEAEMGVTYAAIDHYLATGEGDAEAIDKIESAHRRALHKLNPSSTYENQQL